MKRLGTEIPRLALTPPEAAAAIGCSPGHFDQYVAPGLRWIRCGRKRFVAVTELETWLAANSENPLAEQVAAR